MKYNIQQLEKYGIADYVKVVDDIIYYCVEHRPGFRQGPRYWTNDGIIYESVFGAIVKDDDYIKNNFKDEI